MVRFKAHSLLLIGRLHSGATALLAPTLLDSESQPATVQKREGPIPTLFLGDISQYISPNGDSDSDQTRSSPQKRDVVIDPAGFHDIIPPQGIRIALGPEIMNDIGEIIKDKCKDEKQLEECRKDIQEALQNSNLKAHAKRFVPLLAAATVAEILQAGAALVMAGLRALAIKLGVSNVVQPDLHFDGGPNGALGQMTSMTDASVIAIATGANNDIVATVTITDAAEPTHGPNNELLIEEMKEDKDEYQKGDIVIHIPEQTEQRLLDFLGMMGLESVKETCKKKKARRKTTNLMKRVPPTDTLTPECEEALFGLARTTLEATERALQGLVPANAQNPMNPGGNAEGAAVPNVHLRGIPMVVALVRQVFGPRNAEPGRLDHFLMMAGLVTELVLEAVVIQAETEVELLTVRMAQDIVKKVTKKDLECKKDLVCLDDDCQGIRKVAPFIAIFEDGVEIQTGFCTTTENLNCFCEKAIEPYLHEVEPGYFEELDKFLQALEDSVAHPNCDSNDAIGMDTHRFEEAINDACKNHEELRKLKQRGLSKRVSWEWWNTDKDNLEWYFLWADHSENCPVKCTEVFRQMLDYDKCAWYAGASKSGSVATECGEASYRVDRNTKPLAPPPDPERPKENIWYKLVITQEIKSGDGKIEWELFDDVVHSNRKLEGPAKYHEVLGTSFAMKIIVEEPTNKDKSKIRFQLWSRSQPEKVYDARWYVDSGAKTTGVVMFNWCELISKDSNWKEENGTWRRKVQCTFGRDLQRALYPMNL